LGLARIDFRLARQFHRIESGLREPEAFGFGVFGGGNMLSD
jgi:hypothetical protein